MTRNARDLVEARYDWAAIARDALANATARA